MEPPTNKTGRLAALIYLAMGITAPFSLVYMPARLIVAGNPAATARHVLASESLYRIWMVAELAGPIGSVFAVILLYRLFNRVNAMQAAMMAVLFLMSLPLSLLNVALSSTALTTLTRPDLASAVDRQQIESLVMLLLRLHGQINLVAQVFWGLWLLPLGLLAMRSGFVPRILGILLIPNGISYVLISLTAFLRPDWAHLVERILFPTLLGEVWMFGWLLIKGARVEPEQLSMSTAKP